MTHTYDVATFALLRTATIANWIAHTHGIMFRHCFLFTSQMIPVKHWIFREYHKITPSKSRPTWSSYQRSDLKMSGERIAPFSYFSGTRIRSTNCHSSAKICVSIELNPFNDLIKWCLINTDDSQIGLANFKLEFTFVLCIVCVFVACEQHVHSSKGSDHTIHIRDTEVLIYIYTHLWCHWLWRTAIAKSNCHLTTVSIQSHHILPCNSSFLHTYNV